MWLHVQYLQWHNTYKKSSRSTITCQRVIYYVPPINIVSINQDTFSAMSQLKLLDLGNNKLSSLNETVFAPLKVLCFLFLNDNQLLRLNPSQFSGQSSQLLVINLNSNNLTSLPDTAFANLNKLEWLFLSKNKLVKRWEKNKKIIAQSNDIQKV